MMRKLILRIMLYGVLTGTFVPAKSSLDSHHPLVFATTVAGTVALSKLAYDAANALPAFLANLLEKVPTPIGIRVGLIKITGPILDDVHGYVDQLEYYANHDMFKGILVYINSTGGYPGTSDLLYRALREARAKKPVVVFIDSVCGSGAYLVACGGTCIVITGMASVGSIGVWREVTRFIEHPERKTMYDKGIIAYEFITAGEFKLSGGHPEKPLTASERAYLQEIVNQIYDYFTHAVAHERHLDIRTRDQWANGRVFIGKKAVEMGLADKEGSWHDAQELMKKLIVDQHPNLASTATRSLRITYEDAQEPSEMPLTPSEDLLVM